MDKKTHETGYTKHQFSAEGKLIPKDKQPADQPNQGHKIAPSNALAARLTVLLQNKGVITPDEATWVISGTPTN